MIRDDILVRIVHCFALSAQEVYLVQEVRHSVQLNHVHDVMLSYKSFHSQLELLILVDASLAELGLATAA